MGQVLIIKAKPQKRAFLFLAFVRTGTYEEIVNKTHEIKMH
jgi:hypothetical protein